MDFLLQLDKELFVWINSICSNQLLDVILIPFRNKLFWIPFYLFLISFFVINYGKRSFIILGVITLLMATSDGISSQLIKKTVKRTRPCNEATLQHIEKVHCSTGYSFTSSHATNHFALGTFLYSLFAFTGWRKLFLIWAGIISFAQVYVGVHYPSDVIFGGILGILIGALFFKILLTLNNQILQTA